MKNPRKSDTKTGSQMIQSLESRRLMSFTHGIDFSAATPPPPQAFHGGFNHPFAFVQFNHADAGADGFEFHSFPQQAGATPDIEPQAASATATDTAAAVSATPTVAAPTTLSAMYSSLETSTVIQIDAASTKSLASEVSDSLPDDTHISSTIQSTGATQSLAQAPSDSLVAIDHSDAHEATGIDSFLTSDKALAQAMSVVVAPLPVSSTTDSSDAPSWASIRRLEDELISVKAIASQIVSEIGRESAIALSHVESMIESAIPTNLSGTFTGWRSAAAIASAAVAVVAIARSDSNEEKKKSSVFSDQLIEAVCF